MGEFLRNKRNVLYDEFMGFYNSHILNRLPSDQLYPIGPIGPKGLKGDPGTSFFASYWLNASLGTTTVPGIGSLCYTLSPYKTNASQTDISVILADNADSIITFLTTPTDPQPLQIPPGSWTVNSYCSTTANVYMAVVNCTLSIYHTDTTTTLISTSSSVNLTNSTSELVSFALDISESVQLLPTDCLLLQFKIRQNSGSGFYFTLSCEGNTYSNLATMISTMLIAGPTGLKQGNIAYVDSIYGNDSTGSVGGLPFQTIEAALQLINSGQIIHILPGTYELSGPITIPAGCIIQGENKKNCIIQLTSSTNVVLLTMSINCVVDNLTLKLINQVANYDITCIEFGGTTSQSSTITNCNIIVNSVASSANTYGVNFSGSGTLQPNTFANNAIASCNISVLSNGSGHTRGILVSGTNQVSTRDTNIFVLKPTNGTSTGSYVGVETNDVDELGSIQLRSTTISCVQPSIGDMYIASDILQTTPSSITDPTYLASSGIQIGPGTDLVTKTAGTKGFSTFVYPTIIYYGLKGNISSGTSGGYLWPGTQALSAGVFPDSGLPAAYFRVQQPALISGISGSLNIQPGTNSSVTLSVYISPNTTISNAIVASYTGSISGTTLTVSGVTGTIAMGQSIGGNGIALNTFIVSNIDATHWTVYPSQTVSSTSINNTSYASSFMGTISSTTLSISGLSGLLNIGQYIIGSGISSGTYITAKLTSSTYTVSISQSVSNTQMYSTGLLSTPFTITFGATDTLKTFYDASYRVNTGDRICLYMSYTGSITAHDITCQIDLF